MFIIIIGLIVLLALIIVDKQVNFKEKGRLKALYMFINIYIFLFMNAFVLFLFQSGYEEILFIGKKYYFIISGLLFFILAGMEVRKSRSLKTGIPPILVGLIYVFLLALTKYTIIVAPIVLNIFLTKYLVSLFYPNIKLNYILAYDRHLDEGYENLKFKDIYNKFFYRGDYFYHPLVNKVFTFFSASYKLRAKRKVLIYGSENVDDQFNLMTVVEHYEREEDGYVVFNKIERSINNRYAESDVFALDKITEIANGEYVKEYFASQIINYPKVDFEYKTYIIDLSIVDGHESFRLFDINREEIQSSRIERAYSIKMDNLKDDDKISKYLHDLVKKDVIYNQIVDFFNKGEDRLYEFDRNNKFRLKYDEGVKCFTVYSEEIGLMGRLNREETEEIVNINLPISSNIYFEDEGDLEDFQKYALYLNSDMEDKPYMMYLKFYIEVDLKDAESLKRPNFNLIARFNLELSI